jgi:hypothetical protein
MIHSISGIYSTGLFKTVETRNMKWPSTEMEDYSLGHDQ